MCSSETVGKEMDQNEQTDDLWRKEGRNWADFLVMTKEAIKGWEQGFSVLKKKKITVNLKFYTLGK